jgi:hypothetical protein
MDGRRCNRGVVRAGWLALNEPLAARKTAPPRAEAVRWLSRGIKFTGDAREEGAPYPSLHRMKYVFARTDTPGSQCESDSGDDITKPARRADHHQPNWS